jgi:hypothetical protein
MRVAIQLNDQFYFRAAKIDDVYTQGMLPAEAQAVELVVAQARL